MKRSVWILGLPLPFPLSVNCWDIAVRTQQKEGFIPIGESGWFQRDGIAAKTYRVGRCSTGSLLDHRW